jgi:hypothetical protein
MNYHVFDGDMEFIQVAVRQMLGILFAGCCSDWSPSSTGWKEAADPPTQLPAAGRDHFFWPV